MQYFGRAPNTVNRAASCEKLEAFPVEHIGARKNAQGANPARFFLREC
jgi:hypothetical protein